MKHDAIAKKMRKDFSIFLKSHMKDRGIGFNDLCKKTGIASSYLAKIQRSEANLTLETIARISAFFNRKAFIVFTHKDFL